MSQKKHKALDQINLNQDQSETHGNEGKQSNDSGLRRGLAMTMKRQGQNQKRQHSQNRDDQQHSQHDHTEVDAPVHAASCTGQNVFDHMPCLQRKKEKWSAIT